jgi:hypothetical protein
MTMAAGLLWLLRDRQVSKYSTTQPAKYPSAQVPKYPSTQVTKGPDTNTAVDKTPVPQAVAVPQARKSIDDFKPGPIRLEKAKGSSLIYAVGVLKNQSDYQRFGVSIELELIDARGQKVGGAKDYRAVLEPRQEWRFRALVLESRTVSARVAMIREEE